MLPTSHAIHLPALVVPIHGREASGCPWLFQGKYPGRALMQSRLVVTLCTCLHQLCIYLDDRWTALICRQSHSDIAQNGMEWCQGLTATSTCLLLSAHTPLSLSCPLEGLLGF
jgi:hypothetical protein